MKRQKIVCIVCPKGCRMEVTEDANGLIVKGNQCKRGDVYGKNEFSHPTRVLTSTVRLNHPLHRRMPVVTKGGIPKVLIFEAMKVINKVVLEPPVKMGDIVVENILGTGINVVASKTVADTI